MQEHSSCLEHLFPVERGLQRRHGKSRQQSPPHPHPPGSWTQDRGDMRFAEKGVICTGNCFFNISHSLRSTNMEAKRIRHSLWSARQNLRTLPRFSKARTYKNRQKCSLLPLTRSVTANRTLCLSIRGCPNFPNRFLLPACCLPGVQKAFSWGMLARKAENRLGRCSVAKRTCCAQ